MWIVAPGPDESRSWLTSVFRRRQVVSARRTSAAADGAGHRGGQREARRRTAGRFGPRIATRTDARRRCRDRRRGSSPRRTARRRGARRASNDTESPLDGLVGADHGRLQREPARAARHGQARRPGRGPRGRARARRREATGSSTCRRAVRCRRTARARTAGSRRPTRSASPGRAGSTVTIAADAAREGDERGERASAGSSVWLFIRWRGRGAGRRAALRPGAGCRSRPPSGRPSRGPACSRARSAPADRSGKVVGLLLHLHVEHRERGRHVGAAHRLAVLRRS